SYYRLRIDAKRLAGDEAGAVADCEAAVQIDAKAITPWFLVSFYKRHNQPEKALSYLNSIIDREPGVAVFWRARAKYYAEEAKVDLALADYSQAIALSNNDERLELYLDRGRLFFQQHNPVEALKEAQRVLGSRSDHEGAVDLALDVLL